jgi:DNA polymerase III alpha subunit
MIPLVATTTSQALRQREMLRNPNDVLFHEPARRIPQDVVTCIRHNVTIDEAGFRNATPTTFSSRRRKWRLFSESRSLPAPSGSPA